MIRKIKFYGWKPDIPDIRDRVLNIQRLGIVSLPPKIDLSVLFPMWAVYDQGKLGSCTANAIAAALQFDSMKQLEDAPMLSRLFIYYNERVIEQTTQFDSGAQIRDGIKSVNEQGAPPEVIWAYDISRFTDTPPDDVYDVAKKHEAVEYSRVDSSNIENIKTVLAAGFPIVFGFTVYDNFESPSLRQKGFYLSLPTDEMQVIGGHAVVAVGYDDTKDDGYVKVRNSWGSQWGLGGYYWMPYAYLTDNNLATDFWVVSKVT